MPVSMLERTDAVAQVADRPTVAAIDLALAVKEPAQEAAGEEHPAPEGEPEMRSDRSKRARVGLILLRIALGIALIVAVVLALPELGEAFRVLPNANPWWLVGALVAQTASVALVPQVYRRAARQMRVPMGYQRAWRMALGAFALSRLLPAGGTAGGIYAARHLNRHKVTWPRAGAIVGLAAFTTMYTLGIIVAAGAIIAASQGVASALIGEVVVAGVGLVTVGVAVLPGVMRSPTTRSRIVDFAHRVAPKRVDRQHLQKQLGETAAQIPGLRALSRVMPWAGAQWAFELLALWMAFQALGTPLAAAILVLAVGATNVLIAVPSTPGGIGVVEAGASGALIALGVAAPVAIAGILIARIGSYWLPVGFGLAALAMDRNR